MMKMPPPARYGLPLIGLHWIVAFLIVAAFGLGVTMTEMQGISPTKLKYYSWHKWIGITVLALAAVRLGVRTADRLRGRIPAYPASMPAWQQRAANGLHGVLYGLFFAVPLSGWCFSLTAGFPVVYLGIVPLPVFLDKNDALKPIFREMHEIAAYLLALTVLLHLAAALKHHFIDKDGILRRILPF